MNKGFTLLELLIVSVIIMIIGIMVFGVPDKEAYKQSYIDRCQQYDVSKAECELEFFTNYAY